jgi:cell wall assembly regulator SMI1
VQVKDNLTDPAWQPLSNNVSIVGGQGQAIDLAPAVSQRFYRVVGSR